MKKKKNIINAHTHVFTSQFVPPYLAKTILPWPLYYLVHTQQIVGWIKNYYQKQYRKKFPSGDTYANDWNRIYKARRKRRSNTMLNFSIDANPIVSIPYRLIRFWLSFVALLYVIEFLGYVLGIKDGISSVIESIKEWMCEYYLFFYLPLYGKVIWTFAVIFFISWSRRMILFVIKSIFPLFKKILNKKGLELLDRYLLLGRFALYKTQSAVARAALTQLPEDSEMVILPMDMEYMGSGKTKLRSDIIKNKSKYIENKGWSELDYKDTYKYQMRELWDIVKARRNSNQGNPDAYHPFLFLDPRRIEEEGDSFFNYTIKKNRMVLGDCFVKTYMEDREFSGFKIYPALGYYVFDEYLLPLWRYAVENNIPIMTHCVIGTIYYRGKKKKEWNFHPVFEQYYNSRKTHEPEPMLLPEVKAVHIQRNFTHPLNYLCLLEESLLRKFMGEKVKSQKTRDLFGYSDEKTPLEFTLENLKVCLAHYGGEDEWNKFLESDRDVYSRRMIHKPNEGINFMENSDGKFSLDKINSLWNDTDWYSIISSLLMRYNNMYADLSYIISKPSIYPLLLETLRKGDDYENQYKNYLKEKSPNKKASHLIGRNRLRSHILYGTDFYVVRNHNSDKDLFVETRAALDDESFDLIARENTFNYLSKV